MRRQTLTLPLVAALVVAVGGCELGVPNLNNPDRSRALASGDDVEALIAGSYSNYWEGAHYWDGPMALEVTADHMSASWGNWGMRDSRQRPSIPVENTSNYSFRNKFEEPWEDWYAAVSAASDGLRAIDGGVEIGPGGERNARARAFALFVQGLGGCMIAALFDQAFLVDENTDFGAEIPLVPYKEVSDFYIQKMAEAAQLAQANSFTLPAQQWLAQTAMTNTELAATMRSYMARCKSIYARSPSERAGLAWSSIVADVDAGRTTDFMVTTDEGSDPWWDGQKGLWPEPATWGRANLDFVGQSDQSGNYQAWLNTPTAQRMPVLLTTPDLRMPQSTDAGAEGLYFAREATCCPFPATRGTYTNSYYSLLWHRDYQESCAFCWFGTIPEMLASEMDLIKAEGLIQTGDVAGGASLINKTRVGNGGLTPVAGAGTVPTEPGGGCVPRKRFDPTGSCGDLMDALQYEYYMEQNIIWGGDSYFFTRGHGELLAGRPLHYAIPAKELETLQMEIYTFGAEAECGVPCGSAPVIPGGASVSGDLNFALERVSYALDALEARREANRRMLDRIKRVQ